MRYGVEIEVAPDGSIGAHLPDMTGVVAVAGSEAEALKDLELAVQWHVEALLKKGLALPVPSSREYPHYVNVELGIHVQAA